jgi:hypothetical protein
MFSEHAAIHSVNKSDLRDEDSANFRSGKKQLFLRMPVKLGRIKAK